MRYHLLGIGGVGMSALARLLVHLGHEVSGCDVAPGPYTARLLDQGVGVHFGHDPAHAAFGEVFVHSAGVPADHPELAAARGAGRRVLGRLAGVTEALAGRRVIGVTGTHGKTTTTAMIATILAAAGLDPLVLLGGDLAGFDGNVRLGSGPWAVVEIDESDPTFAAVGVEIAVITNLEDDHVADRADMTLNYHASVEALRETTRAFASGARICVFDSDWPGLADLLSGLPVTTCGLGAGATWSATDAEHHPAGTTALVVRAGHPVSRIALRVPGRHNLRNALAAIAASAEAGLDPGDAATALATFQGASRRWTRLGEPGGVLVVDDYAHHPTEVRATLDVASSLGRRVRVVFQPHRHGRFQQMWRRFADALEGVDEAIILPVFAAGEAPVAGPATPADLARELTTRGVAAIHLPSQVEAIEYLAASARSGDLVLTMGAGDITDLGPRLLHRLAANPAANPERAGGGGS